MYTFLGVQWHNVEYIFFLPFFLLGILFFVRSRRNLMSALKHLVDPVHQKRLLPHFSSFQETVKTILMCLALVLIFIAFLRPAWGKKESVVHQEGRDVLILFDVSRSMLAQDLKPNRLEFAKLKVRSLLSKLTIERLGLVLFSGSAFLQCPLTADHDAFLMFLNQVDVETIASGTTAIDNALAKAMDIFKKSEGRKNKLIILITDGEDFSMNLQEVKRLAQEQKVTLFTLGVGTVQGAPIPIVDEAGNTLGHEKDKKGSIALSKLNEQTLSMLGKELNGVYVKSTYNDGDVETIARMINTFEKEKFGDKKVSLYEERYPWFLGAAFALLALEWVL